MVESDRPRGRPARRWSDDITERTVAAVHRQRLFDWHWIWTGSKWEESLASAAPTCIGCNTAINERVNEWMNSVKSLSVTSLTLTTYAVFPRFCSRAYTLAPPPSPPLPVFHCSPVTSVTSQHSANIRFTHSGFMTHSHADALGILYMRHLSYFLTCQKFIVKIYMYSNYICFSSHSTIGLQNAVAGIA